jgi:ribosomal-protein-alanine N-acetyltransferase
MDIKIVDVSGDDDMKWAARLMAANEPWITLRRDYDACLDMLTNAAKERYIVRADGARAGLLVLDMNGPFPGYIQTIGVATEARNRGIGSHTLAWAEERIFRDSPNVFMCVSSFNRDARRLYDLFGYETIATLRSFIVDEHDELLLRKTRGSWEWFRRQTNLSDGCA